MSTSGRAKCQMENNSWRRRERAEERRRGQQKDKIRRWKKRLHCQLTIAAAVAGEIAIPELVCRATTENAKRTKVLHIVSRDRRMPTYVCVYVNMYVNV